MSRQESEKLVLVLSIFVAGLCSIVYELLISTTSSYFLGDSVKQFSITIGVYMAAMGLGSYLSRIIQRQLLAWFIGVELLLGLIGGSSVPVLYFVFSAGDYTVFSTTMIGLILLIGTLTGLEIPLLTRIMKQYYPLKINLSNVLSLDYLGALLATLLFPFILLPWVGVFLSSLVFGLVNVGLGLLNLWYFSSRLGTRERRRLMFAGIAMLVYFGVLLFAAQHLLARWSDGLYRDRIVHQETTPYQNMVLTKHGADVRLYLDRVIQFSSIDEYRYHESLVHPALSLAPYRYSVLILGGGEGLAAREALKYPDITSIKIIDIDPAVFSLGRDNRYVQTLNAGSLDDDRVQTITEDAFVFLQQYNELFDVIIADLPDPTSEGLARLYSKEFFKLALRRLTPYGIFVTQATSPFHTKQAYWCINESIKAAGFTHTYPYHAYVPSFGDWGFVMASQPSIDTSAFPLSVNTQFLDEPTLRRLFHFEKDLIPQSSLPVNTLDQPVLLDYYLTDWRKWSRKHLEN